MAKILLIAPPYLDLYGKISKAAGRYFPLGIAYIAAYLRKFGNHEVSMYEMETQKITGAAMLSIVKKNTPDVIGITCTTPTFSNAVQLASLLRTCTRAKIVLGGVHVSAIPEHVINQYHDVIDFVVCGEGEITMLALCDAVHNGTSVNSIPGIAFYENGRVVRTVSRSFITDLDSIPFPARDLIPQHLFYPNLHNARRKRCFSLLTSRGCPFNCSFCASRIVSGVQYRVHSAEYVLAEMEMLKKDYGAQQLLITDDTFTLQKERLVKICNGMIKARLKLDWFCFAQVSSVNRDLLKLMKEAGCYSIGFGVESANQEILRKIGKAITPAIAYNAIHDANAVGLKTQAFYVFGVQDETLAEARETIAFAKKTNATLAFFNMLVPYPGTRDFDYYFSKNDLATIDWNEFVAIGEKCVLKKSALAEHMEKLMAEAYREYYANPMRLWMILRSIGSFYEFKNYFFAVLGLVSQIWCWIWPNKKCTLKKQSNEDL